MGDILLGPQPTMDYSKFLTLPDSDNIRIKNVIKQKLLANSDILYLLNAKEEYLDPSDYFNKYIFPYLIIEDSNPNVNNYICYETSFSEIPNTNKVIKNMQIYFYIYFNKSDAIHSESGIARHDLVAALIERDINWSEAFGCKCKLVSNRPSTTDLNYATRTLVFESDMPNGISKTDMKTGLSYFCNDQPDDEW
mgnify:CR=1 FL=1